MSDIHFRLDRKARIARFAAASAALQAALADWLQIADPTDMEVGDAVEDVYEALRELLDMRLHETLQHDEP